MQLTRLELYERVCGSPLSKIGPEFGISGTALAALCRQHQIPYPGSAYWTRKSLGLPVELSELCGAPDETLEITPRTPKPRPHKATDNSSPPKTKTVVKTLRLVRHPLLSGVEEYFRKTRDLGEYEFLKPYKRVLPDLISSEPALPRALSIANNLYLALDKEGCHVHIAPAQAGLCRIRINEQEVEQKDRKYGRYQSGSIWVPDRPTIFYIDAVPVGLALIEMTERVTMRYLNGKYYREDSDVIRSAKPRQLIHSWTTGQDVPSGRFRLFAYSPKNGVDWSMSWQETEQEPLDRKIPTIVGASQTAESKLQRLMTAADEAAAKRKKEWEEQRERYERQEDARKASQALSDSKQQLTEIIEKWGKAVAVEQFFAEAEERLATADENRRQLLMKRLALAREMMGSLDPLDFIEKWLAPEERYISKYP